MDDAHKEICIDDSALYRIPPLIQRYIDTYGQRPDLAVMPDVMTLEDLEECLQIMIDDNLSVICAYQKLHKSKCKGV